MKTRTILLFVICFYATNTAAQIDVKVNPINLLLGQFSASAEIGLANALSIESLASYSSEKNVNSIYTVQKHSLGIAFKYFFKPQKGVDQFYLSPVFKYQKRIRKSELELEASEKSELGAGLLIGYKWVSVGGFIFETGIGGVGKFLLTSNYITRKSRFNPYVRVLLGYRIGK